MIKMNKQFFRLLATNAFVILTVLTIAAVFKQPATISSSQPNTPVSTPSNQPSLDPAIQFTLSRVVDGDTIVADASDGAKQWLSQMSVPVQNSYTIRILGIDTPELNKNKGIDPACGAQDATDRLSQMIGLGEPVSLTFDSASATTDRYNRLLAKVSTSIYSDIGSQLINEGFASAWIPSSAKTPDGFATYQQQTLVAKATSTGSWAKCPSVGRFTNN